MKGYIVVKKPYKYSAFGERLRNIREKKYPDINTFAKVINIKKENIYNYELGRIFPPINNFIKICKALDKSPDYFLLTMINLKKEDEELMEIINRIKYVWENEGNRERLKEYIGILEHRLNNKNKCK